MLAREFGARAFAFLRQHREIHQLGEALLVGWAVKAFVEAHARHWREAADQRLDQRHGHLVVGSVRHDTTGVSRLRS
ncbi:hypothetical protein G3446_27370 [Thiorhodococcus minor]|uniref:Uncharacterized protein n=1 Tax=Thiorhodococcus minor TaxID=57489 RepID=A0A6M0K7K4_9GAMM|nr:hypothetical protein [Thiorhodococcus minor]